MPERALLVVLMAAMLIFLIAQAPLNARLSYQNPEVPLGARMGGSLLAVMFLMPVLAYGLAALVWGLSKLTPWRLSSENARLSLFWALLAVSPAMLLAGLIDGMIGDSPALTIARAVAGIGFMVIWGAGISVLAVRK